MSYTKTTWQNSPSTNTPINAANLNHMEQGIYDATNTADSAAAGVSALQGLNYAPTPVQTVAEMTDHTKNYVYLGSEAGYTANHWYYWNGSAWTEGGVYNAQALVTDTTLELAGEAADAKATGDAISAVNSALIQETQNIVYKVSKNLANPSNFGEGIRNADGTITENASYVHSGLIPVTEGKRLRIANWNGASLVTGIYCQHLTALDSGENVISAEGKDSNFASYVVPEGIAYVDITFLKTYTVSPAYIMIAYADTVEEFPPAEKYYAPHYEYNDDFLTAGTKTKIANDNAYLSTHKEKIDERLDMYKANGLNSQIGITDGLGLENNVNNNYVSKVEVIRTQRPSNSRRIIAINHDDLQAPDYIGTWRLYSKYGFNANFSFILYPFASLAEQSQKVECVRQMILNGNDIGLHAIFQQSAWFMNKMFDIRPNETFTYAPTLSNQTTVVDDGKNVFGYTVSGAKLSDLGFANPPAAIADVVVTNMTSNQYVEAIKHYCVYFMTGTVTGLDLDGNEQTWSILKWLEYWYNNLIDDSLGYSSTEATTIARFVEDFDVPNGTAESAAAYNAYYPDAEHLANGKIVYFDDTTNPNYSDPDYQKVGRFGKGLFKDHATILNGEIVGRCIDIARAFLRHYYGFDDLTTFDRHGVRYVDCYWMQNGLPFDDSNCTIVGGEVGRFFDTENFAFVTEQEILISRGIRMSMHVTPIMPIIEAQDGMYFGQNGIRYPFFHGIQGKSGQISYMNMFGSDSSNPVENMNYNTFMDYVGGVNDLLKYAYEKAGTTITKPDGTGNKYMYSYIKNAIDRIKACADTGKIPCFSWDTIARNASMMAAVETILRYCYENNYQVVTFEKAREIASTYPKDTKQNYMPNPNFTQSLINMFGGASTSKEAYIPDGWGLGWRESYSTNYIVGPDTIDGKTRRYFSAQPESLSVASVMSRIYGMPSGTYKFSCYAKGNGKLNLYLKKNSDFLNTYANNIVPDFSVDLTGTWTMYETTFTIEAPYCGIEDVTNPISEYCHGYEQNVSNVTVELMTNGDSSVFISDPKLEVV